MALKGLDIFKLTPKTNCKECGNPTCMAFAMKVAQGSIEVGKCPHMSPEALAKLAEATEPPMKTILFGGEKLGGETVLLRHEKTFVNRNLFGVAICTSMDDETIGAVLSEAMAIDYERIGERMYVECILVNCRTEDGAERAVVVSQKATSTGRLLAIKASDANIARCAVEAAGGEPILIGAQAGNYEAMNAVAVEKSLALGVEGASLQDVHDTVEKLEKLGNKRLIINIGNSSIKEAFAAAMQIRRSALKDGDGSFGYPTLLDLASIAPEDYELQAALASVFTLRYGSVIVMERMGIAAALPLYGLRQNIFTDPQKPRKVEPGIYPVNGADENAICVTTVDFALTYFVVSGELERSGVPVNLLVSDAGGYSVLTAWAAGKLSAGSIAKFFDEFAIESKIKNRTLIIPGKVAVLKGEIESKLPGWKIVVGPSEAIALVRFLREQ
jgi:acetyl-CoA decarbonylase/synthase complex subunit gamma